MVVEMMNIIKDFEYRSTFKITAPVKSRLIDLGVIVEADCDVQGGEVFVFDNRNEVYVFGGMLCSNFYDVDDLNGFCDELNERYYVAPKVSCLAGRCVVCGGTYGLHTAADLSGIACTLCGRCDDGTVSLA